MDRYEDLIIECHDNPAYTADLIMKQEAELTALREENRVALAEAYRCGYEAAKMENK